MKSENYLMRLIHLGLSIFSGATTYESSVNSHTTASNMLTAVYGGKSNILALLHVALGDYMATIRMIWKEWLTIEEYKRPDISRLFTGDANNEWTANNKMKGGASPARNIHAIMIAYSRFGDRITYPSKYYIGAGNKILTAGTSRVSETVG